MRGEDAKLWLNCFLVPNLSEPPFCKNLTGFHTDASRINTIKCADEVQWERCKHLNTSKGGKSRFVLSEQGGFLHCAAHTCGIQSFFNLKQDRVPAIRVHSASLPFVSVYLDDIQLILVWNQLHQPLSAQTGKSSRNISSQLFPVTIKAIPPSVFRWLGESHFSTSDDGSQGKPPQAVRALGRNQTSSSLLPRISALLPRTARTPALTARIP